MDRYATDFSRSSVANGETIGNVNAAGSGPRRFSVYDILFGSAASPADQAARLQAKRATDAGASATSKTPRPLDSGAAAFSGSASQAPQTEPTVSETLLSIPFNQRATFRWVAAPGSELICPATASNGFAFQGANPTSSFDIDVTVLFME